MPFLKSSDLSFANLLNFRLDKGEIFFGERHGLGYEFELPETFAFESPGNVALKSFEERGNFRNHFGLAIH